MDRQNKCTVFYCFPNNWSSYFWSEMPWAAQFGIDPFDLAFTCSLFYHLDVFLATVAGVENNDHTNFSMLVCINLNSRNVAFYLPTLV